MIENNVELRPVADDYLKLFEAYKTQHKNGMALSDKVDELNTLLAGNQKEIEQFLKESNKNKEELGKLLSY